MRYECCQIGGIKQQKTEIILAIQFQRTWYLIIRMSCYESAWHNSIVTMAKYRGSDVWKYFTKTSDADGKSFTVCKLCKEKLLFHNSTSTMHYHVKHKHPCSDAKKQSLNATSSQSAPFLLMRVDYAKYGISEMLWNLLMTQCQWKYSNLLRPRPVRINNDRPNLMKSPRNERLPNRLRLIID